MNRIKLGIIGSTKGTDLQAILDAIQSGELSAEVSVVISNRKTPIAFTEIRWRDGYECSRSSAEQR